MSVIKCRITGGVNAMTFFREGKKLNYAEVVETLSILIKQNVLPQLETDEIYNLFLKLFSFTEDIVGSYLEKAGYKVVNSKQTFLTASKLKLICDEEVWTEAIQVKNNIESGGHSLTSKETLTTFISEPYYRAMKGLKTNLESK